ncbi:hypothetical protein [uncultured Duncaniella sp.]|uniref:hypothetical protein n=1 Tax=uncultured Duncaniella sp. TaxID=2768039 RepID=UPI0025A9C551|nr:hypothetical protein [uncultured Duncaniella sp.]
MKFLKKIFVCCCRFQERIGNGDMPVDMSMGMILFTIYIYLTAISIGVSFYWGNIIGKHLILDFKKLMLYNILICCLIGGNFYLKYLKDNRLNQTLSIEISESDKISAVVFIIGSIVSLCGVFMFMWAVNNGFILEGGKE